MVLVAAAALVEAAALGATGAALRRWDRTTEVQRGATVLAAELIQPTRAGGAAAPAAVGGGTTTIGDGRRATIRTGERTGGAAHPTDVRTPVDRTPPRRTTPDGAASAAVLAPADAATAAWVLDADRAWLAFEARLFGFTILGGRFDRFDVALPVDTASGRRGLDLRVAAASLDTELAPRDARLVGPAWLDAARYPDIVFRSRRVEPIPVVEGSLTRVTGDLTIRGRTHPAHWDFELVARAQDAAGELGAEYTGRLELAPRKWGLGRASLAVTVVLHLIVLAGDRIADAGGASVA
jgi:polyisoprenoid-binding protein YceI